MALNRINIRRVFLLTIMAISLVSGCTLFRMDDGRNETLASRKITSAHPGLKEARIRVTSFNGILLITGQVPSPDLLALATQAARSLRNVRQVHNELTVAGPTSFMARTNDKFLSTKIRLSLSSGKVAGKVKIITENGVVYLMGLVTGDEAEAVVEVARNTHGVQKVIKVFELIR